jgi:hypothetical protein
MIQILLLIIFARLAVVALGLTRGRYTFHPAIEDAERMEESTDDITAAAMVPNPMVAMNVGVRYRMTYGKISAASGGGPGAPA